MNRSFTRSADFTESPKRCPSCRQIRKAQRSRPSSYEGGGSSRDSYGGNGYGGASGGYSDSSSGGYSSGGYSGSGGYSSSGGYSTGGYSERRPREMFEATCANCGSTASVPFRPSGSKPVYCSDCFESRR